MVAYLVGAREVASVTGLLPFVNERLNFGVEQLRLAFAENVEHGVEAIDERKYVALVVGAQGVVINGRVDLALEVVDGCERDRGVEVVVHPGLELFERARGDRAKLRVRARFGARRAQARDEVAQRFDRLLRAAQALEGEVELLAVGHAQEQITNRRGIEAAPAEVSERVVVAARLRH